jgi:hypothetical protein
MDVLSGALDLTVEKESFHSGSGVQQAINPSLYSFQFLGIAYPLIISSSFDVNLKSVQNVI